MRNVREIFRDFQKIISTRVAHFQLEAQRERARKSVYSFLLRPKSLSRWSRKNMSVGFGRPEKVREFRA